MPNDRLKPKTRRDFLKLAGAAAVTLGMSGARSEADLKKPAHAPALLPEKEARNSDTVTLFLCGDVMTGRGIDQILPHPSHPEIYEPYMTSARGYVQLAEKANGPIPMPVGFSYIWGEALEELKYTVPDARIINLETAVTASSGFWPGKGIHYRMHPRNIPCLTAAKIDCCVLANNHVLDWGYAGLAETLTVLAGAHLKTAGAGLDLREAEAPATIEAAGKGRVLVFGLGGLSSGIPWLWGARRDKPGVNLLADLSEETVKPIAKRIAGLKQKGDCVVASIHWGGNWGYRVSPAQREFAHRLIDAAQVDMVHGHSSHHPMGLEIYRGKLILYGCGDFLNDYEGISGHEEFRGDLSLMYFITLDRATGKLAGLTMTPMQIKRFRLNYAQPEDVRWLQQVLTRESLLSGASIQLADKGRRLALAVGRQTA